MFNNKHKTRQLFAILISLALIISQFGIMPLSAYGQDDDYDSVNTVYESESEAADAEDSLFAEEDENAFSVETEEDSITEAEEDEDVPVEPEKDVSGKPEEDVSGEPEKVVSTEPEEDVSGEPEEVVSGEPEEVVSEEPEEDVSGKPEEVVSGEPEEVVQGEPEESLKEEAEPTPEPAGEAGPVKSLTVLTFSSDVHNGGSNANGNTAANRLGQWVDKIVKLYGGIDIMSFCGDMASAMAGESAFWTLTKSAMDVVSEKGIDQIHTTGNHEYYNGKFDTTSNSVRESYILDSEAVVGGNFRIYCLGTDNWNNNSDNYTTAQIASLEEYLNNTGSDKPIIILTHFPLHYFQGSYARQTTNAIQVINVLNEASAAGKKIVLLWGHNHSVSDTHYDKIYEPGTSLQYEKGSYQTIDFYYGAAGCMSDSENGTGSAFVKGKGLVITINSENRMTFAYYDEVGNEISMYTESDPVNAAGITVSPKTLTLEAGSSGSLTVQFDPAETTNRKVVWSSSDPAIAEVSSSGVVTGIAKGTVVITATYVDGGFTDTCEVTVTRPAGQGVTPENGKKYVILAGDGYALTSEGDTVGYSNGSDGSQQYNYTGLTGEAYTVGEEVAPDRLLWTFTASEDGSGYNIQSNNGAYLNGRYEANDSGGYNGTLKLDDEKDVWVITGGSSGALLKSTNASQSDAGDKFLAHGNGDNSDSNIFSLRSEDNSSSVRFYEYSDEGAYVPDPDDPEPDDPTPDDPTPDDPVPTEGTVYKLVDQFTDGKEYLIVNTSSTGSAYALTNPGGSSGGAGMGQTDVTVQSGDVDGDGTSDKYITSEAAAVIWKAAANDTGVDLTNGSDYLEGSGGEVKIFSEQQYPARYWTYIDDQLQHVGGRNTYTVYYSSGFTSTYNDNSYKVYLFEKVGQVSVIPDDPVVPDDPDPTEGTAYALADSLEAGKKYIIASSNTAGSTCILGHDGETARTYSAVIAEADGKLTITTDKTDVVFEANEITNGCSLTNGEYYMTVEGSGTLTFGTSASTKYWNYSDSKLSNSSSSATRYLTFSDSEFKGYYSSSSSNPSDIFLFVEETEAPHEHSWNEGEVTTPATCTAEGVMTFTCSICGATETQAIPMIDHTPVTDPEVLPTCTETGLTEGSHCSECNKVLEAQQIIPETGHTPVRDPAVVATCENSGMTEGSHCLVCGKVLVEREVIPAFGHVWSEWKLITAATCTGEGLKTRYCLRCGELEKSGLDAYGHNWEFQKFSWGENEEYTVGTAFYVCANNEEHTQNVTVEILKTLKEPTCTKAGQTTYTALISKEDALDGTARQFVLTITGQPLGHTVVTDKAIAPTCTKTGLTKGSHCSVCNEILTPQQTVPAKGHSYRTVTTKATLTANGKIESRCSACDKLESSTVIYRPKTFTLSASSYTYDGTVKKPTVKVTDTKGKTISSSDYSVSYASGRKNVGTYTVTVKMKNKYSGTKTLTFKINPKGTSLKSLTGASKAMTVQWNEQSSKMASKRITGYQIQLATDSGFTKNVKSPKVKGYSAVSKKITGLSSGKKYYVRIRTYMTAGDKTYYSPWSAAKSVKTK